MLDLKLPYLSVKWIESTMSWALLHWPWRVECRLTRRTGELFASCPVCADPAHKGKVKQSYSQSSGSRVAAKTSPGSSGDINKRLHYNFFKSLYIINIKLHYIMHIFKFFNLIKHIFKKWHIKTEYIHVFGKKNPSSFSLCAFFKRNCLSSGWKPTWIIEINSKSNFICHIQRHTLYDYQ